MWKLLLVFLASYAEGLKLGGACPYNHEVRPEFGLHLSGLVHCTSLLDVFESFPDVTHEEVARAIDVSCNDAARICTNRFINNFTSCFDKSEEIYMIVSESRANLMLDYMCHNNGSMMMHLLKMSCAHEPDFDHCYDAIEWDYYSDSSSEEIREGATILDYLLECQVEEKFNKCFVNEITKCGSSLMTKFVRTLFKYGTICTKDGKLHY